MIDYTDRQTDRRTECKNIYIDIFTLCLSVRVVDHALTAVRIDFIFDMHIDVIPRSDIGILDFQFLIIKDHLWTK